MWNHFRNLSYLWLFLLAMPSAASTTRIWVLNSASGTIDVIDPATNKIVQTIPDIPKPHGVAFSRDGKLAYVSSEAEDQENGLYLVDTKSGEILKRAPLSGRRGNVPAITKDGKRLLVCVNSPRDGGETGTNGNGALDVVDTSTLKVVKSFPVKGHDCYTTPDGKYWIAGSGVGSTSQVYVIDVKTEETAWTFPLKNGIAPIGIETGPDGSTRRLFVTPLFQFKGREIVVVDFATHQEVSRIELPDQPSGFRVAPPLAWRNNGIPVHGLDISPDGKTIAIASRTANALFFYSLPDLKFLGFVPAPTVERAQFPNNGSDPSWLTFTPDSKTLYLSCGAGNVVAVIDVKTMKEVARIPVGKQPDHVYPLALQ